MAKKQRQNTRKSGGNNASTTSGGTTGPGGTGSSQSSLQSQLSASDLQPSSSSSNMLAQSSNHSDDNIVSQPQTPFSQQQQQPASQQTHAHAQCKTLYEWINAESEGIFWVLGCATLGAILGFGVGSGWFTGGSGAYQMILQDIDVSTNTRQYTRAYVVVAWRMALAGRIRKMLLYEMLTFRRAPWNLFGSIESDGSDEPVTGGDDDDDYWSSFKSGDGAETNSLGKKSPASTPEQHYASSILVMDKNDYTPGAELNLPHDPAMDSKQNEQEQHEPQTSYNWNPLRYLWPPNWLLFSNVDLSLLDVGDRGLSPMMVSLLSFMLPWRRPIIQALAQKDWKRDENVHSSYSTFSVDPYFHPMAFNVLREYVLRFDNGYVHPDLGFLVPAPSGASRGLGMMRDSYNKCQIHCTPGTAEEKIHFLENAVVQDNATLTYQDVQDALHTQSTSTSHPYTQEEILLHIPLEAQITRIAALNTLKPIVNNLPIEELDDAPLLALYLAYERGLGPDSRIWPYIATLPRHPSCGWNREWRQAVVDVVTAMSVEMGTDVQGWPGEISKAAELAEKVSRALGREYGSFLMLHPGMGIEVVTESIRWSLCQVSSRAVAGRESYGSLRLVPMMDMVNHDGEADKFVELTGKESVEGGDFLDASEDDAGAFVVRSRRYGRRKALRKGQVSFTLYVVDAAEPSQVHCSK